MDEVGEIEYKINCLEKKSKCQRERVIHMMTCTNEKITDQLSKASFGKGNTEDGNKVGLIINFNNKLKYAKQKSWAIVQLNHYSWGQPEFNTNHLQSG